jgi:hypothetical protein
MFFPTHHFIVWCAMLGAFAYSITWAAVVLANVHADHERVWVERVLWLATEAADDARAHDAALALLIRRVPLSASLSVLRSSSPRGVREAVARGLVNRIGIARLHGNPTWRQIGRRRWWRITALQVLILSDRASAWDLLESAVVDSDPEVAAAAVMLAGQLPEVRAAAILVGALRGGLYSRSQVAAVLDLFPMNIADLVEPLLRDQDSALRYWGTILMRRYPGRPALATRLRAMVQDNDPLVRKAAIDAAAAVGGPHGFTIARSGLGDAAPFVRGHAAQALAAIGGEGAATSIAPLLADSDWRTRSAAIQSLVRLGSGPAEAVVPFLRHSEEFARNSAAEVLQEVGEFERLLLLEVEGASDPVHHATLQYLASAGGAEMRRVVLDHLRPAARQSGETILANLDIAEKS